MGESPGNCKLPPGNFFKYPGVRTHSQLDGFSCQTVPRLKICFVRVQVASTVCLKKPATHIYFSNNSVNKKAQLTQGLRATAVRVCRHLGFLKFESCTISSDVPENPTLEPNMEWSDAPFARYSRLNYTVTLKLAFGVTEGHRKQHYSIEHIRLYIRLL